MFYSVLCLALGVCLIGGVIGQGDGLTDVIINPDIINTIVARTNSNQFTCVSTDPVLTQYKNKIPCNLNTHCILNMINQAVYGKTRQFPCRSSDITRLMQEWCPSQDRTQDLAQFATALNNVNTFTCSKTDSFIQQNRNKLGCDALTCNLELVNLMRVEARQPVACSRSDLSRLFLDMCPVGQLTTSQFFNELLRRVDDKSFSCVSTDPLLIAASSTLINCNNLIAEISKYNTAVRTNGRESPCSNSQITRLHTDFCDIANKLPMIVSQIETGNKKCDLSDSFFNVHANYFTCDNVRENLEKINTELRRRSRPEFCNADQIQSIRDEKCGGAAGLAASLGLLVAAFMANRWIN